MTKSIEIRTLADIRDKVPHEKMDDFMADLKAWLKGDHLEIEGIYADAIDALVNQLGFDKKVKRSDTDVLMWVDDGKVGLSTIDIKDGDGNILANIEITGDNKNE